MRKFTVLANVVVFVFLVIFLEILSAIIYKNLPKRYNNGKRIVEFNVTGVKIDTNSSIIPHPYLLYANKPNYYIAGIRQTNGLGYRAKKDFAVRKDPRKVRILALGGSTTYGFLNPDADRTWPAVLEKKLRERFGDRVEVINAGLNFGTSAELLAGYVFRHKYLYPEIIIFHEGGNDSSAVVFPEYNPEYTHLRAHGKSESLRPGEKWLLRFYSMRLLYTFWLNQEETVYVATPFTFDKLSRSEVKPRVQDESNYEGFRRNLDTLIKLAKAENSDVVLFGFLHAKRENFARNLKVLDGLEDSLIYAIDKDNRIMMNLADKYGLLYIQPDQCLFKDEWFLDSCHLTNEGEVVKARLVFEKLAPLVEERLASKMEPKSSR
jgi:lysophospholipase L1-like esterase